MQSKVKRQTELDILRLFATLAVILMHADGHPYLKNNLDPKAHSMFIAALVWCVPAFFMISGRFFLDPSREVTAKKILSKYIPRIITAFLVWSAIYVLYYIFSGAYAGLNIWGICTQFIDGPYHFWFLYSLLGLYLLTPILRKVASDKKVLQYFLILFLIFNLIYEYLVYIPKIGAIINTLAGKIDIGIVGYVGYFVLGYFLYSIRKDINTKTEVFIYVLGATSLVATVILEGKISSELQGEDFVKQYLKPNVIIFSAAIYVFFIKRVAQHSFSERAQQLLAKLTELSFGVYILHALVNELLAFIPLPQPVRFPYLVLILLSIFIYLIGLFLTWLIRKIPYLGKKIT